MHSCPFIYLYTPSLKKCGALWYTFRSKNCVECPSVCPSVTISFPLTILSTFQPILFNFILELIFGGGGGVVKDHRWVSLSNKHRDIALYVENWFRCSILASYFINFLQILNESRYMYKDLGVLWDCKSLNFVKKLRPLI